ncbi:FluG domain-containing protein [Metarhizium guizhouense ARSEF 977]|uniref:FluG domain-containing protein n=1 Tax=Metarhizium guizhouense (strain ARSEF 977) TaxID=1276136 RepID=A0A0B4HXM5_METGA|nr:FluG domain-containing protein [Metarhizium guizhouense ARSEF 977]
MASTAALETSVTAHNDTEKDARARGRLLTPEPTPGVEDGRVAADLARKAADTHNVETPTSPAKPAKPATGTDATEVKLDDVQQEIERVLRCADESYAEILAVSQSSTEEEILTAWRRLGCMLHPHYFHHNDSKAVYKKLRRAARQMGVDQVFIDEVTLWDGEEALPAGDSESDDDDNGKDAQGDVTMAEDEVPKPPDRVKDIYREAIPLLYKLGHNPSDKAFLDQLNGLNHRISAGNKTHNKYTTEKRENPKISSYYVLLKDPKNEAARKNLVTETVLIDEHVTKHHLPEEWSFDVADDFLKANAADLGPVPANPNRIEYPWPTAKAADGFLIIGVRQQGKWGTQVCVETTGEDGGLVRRLEPASSVGLLEVEHYKAMAGHKHLADGLNKVLGPASARAKIETVCERDGIPTPWKAGWVSYYNDPAKVEKDPTRRRAMKDAQADELVCSVAQIADVVQVHIPVDRSVALEGTNRFKIWSQRCMT